MKTQFVTDDLGKKLAVILPMAEYEKILEELEELEDIKLYDQVKSRKEETMPFADYMAQRKQKRHA